MSDERNIPGVNTGEPLRVKSPPARISLETSPWHPSFTPSRPMHDPVVGVGRIPHVDGGLLAALPDDESAGVGGYIGSPCVPQLVSSASCCPSY